MSLGKHVFMLSILPELPLLFVIFSYLLAEELKKRSFK